MDIVKMIGNCNWRISMAREQITKFQEKLGGVDPANAISWGEEYFMYAAEHKVYTAIAQWAEAVKKRAEEGQISDMAETVANYKATLVERVLEQARDKMQSTSAVANIMDNYIRIALAKAVADNGLWK